MQWTFVFVSVFAIFIPALMLPGPDFIAVVRSSMARGARAGLLTTLGVTLGLGFYAGLSLCWGFQPFLSSINGSPGPCVSVAVFILPGSG